ncbi:MAG: Leu/Phe-tRNA-protein transferase, partial [Saprospiraceae bacterium]
ETGHLKSLGGRSISRSSFLKIVGKNQSNATTPRSWNNESADLFSYVFDAIRKQD